MNRPTGVSILAVLCFIGAGFCLLGGIGALIGGGAIASMISQQGQAGAGIFAALGAAAGIMIIIIGGVYALVGMGLWKVKNWARITTIVLTVIGAVMQLPGLFAALVHFNVLALLWVAFWLAIDVWIVMYLLKPEIKAAFQGPSAMGASA